MLDLQGAGGGDEVLQGRGIERGGRLKVNLGPGSLGFPCREIEMCVGS